MATYGKSQTKFQPPDWFMNSFMHTANSVNLRESSNNIRQHTRSLRLSANLQTKWDQYNNTTRLADRLDALISYKDILDLTFTNLDDEIEKLSQGKDAMEKQLTDLQKPEECVKECLTLRDRRYDIDFVEDGPEYELKSEKNLIANYKKHLQQRISESLDQLLLLREARNQILKDLQDKNETIDIDTEQYKLGPNCPGVSYKIKPTRIPKGTTTLKQWEEFTRYNWQRAQAEIAASERLRSAIFDVMSQTENDIEAQSRATEFALRKRVHEDLVARDELNWQKLKIEEEIAEILNDLEKLELEILDQIPYAKLAETRLERRTYRPGVDLCRDDAQYGLTNEVRQLDVTKQALLEKQRQARHALDGLERELSRLKKDIAVKDNSIKLDTDCLKSRQEKIGGQGIKDTENHCNELMVNRSGDALSCESKVDQDLCTNNQHKFDPVSVSQCGQWSKCEN